MSEDGRGNTALSEAAVQGLKRRLDEDFDEFPMNMAVWQVI